MTSASSAAVHGGGGGSGGWAAAVATTPKNIAPASVPTPIAPLTARRVGRAEGNILAPSSGDQVAVTDDGWRQKQAKQNIATFLAKRL
jgi:hypothetical protein